MPERSSSRAVSRPIARTFSSVHRYGLELRSAWRAVVIRHRHPLRLALTTLWLCSIPAIAHAGIWNGGLCTVYQDVLDNELLEVVSLSALVGSIVLWLLDDGRSNIKTHVLRGVLGTLAILNMPLLWAQVFNHGAACTGSI